MTAPSTSSVAINVIAQSDMVFWTICTLESSAALMPASFVVPLMMFSLIYAIDPVTRTALSTVFFIVLPITETSEPPII